MKIYLFPMSCPGRGLLFFIVFSITYSVDAQKRENSVFGKKRHKVEISDLELRLRLTDAFIRFTEDVEECADKIFYNTSDPEIRRAALMWKIYGISAMNKSINMPDPIASFYDAWPLTKQMIDFFESGNGKQVFAEKADLALKTCIKHEARFDSIIIDMTNLQHFQEAESQTEKWAQNHPIEDFYFARESTMSIFAQWLGAEQFGLGKSVATITEEVIELSNKLNIYVDLMPRQARWQADYAVLNYLQDSTFEYNLSTLLSSMERITAVIEMSPEIIEYNREMTMRDIDEQREKSLRLLISERKAVIEEIRKERVEIVSKIIEERMVVLDELKNERAIVLDEIRNLSSDVVLQSSSEIERITDKIFWKLTMIYLIFGVVILLAVILYKKL